MRKIVSILFCLIMCCFACSCSRINTEVPSKPEISYNVKAAYLGDTYFCRSENSPYFAQYDSYDDIVDDTIEAVVAEYGTIDIGTIISQSKRVVIIAPGMSKEALFDELFDTEYYETTENEGYSFIGAVVDTIGESKNIIGIYSTEKPTQGSPELTDYIAYCASFDFNGYYQGNKFVTTEPYPMEKAVDVFNIFNIEDKAYSVSLMTLVDFLNNPTVTKTHYLFQHTVAYTSTIIPISVPAGDFTDCITVNNDGWEIKMAPNSDIDFGIGDEDSLLRNFYFYRIFDVSRNTEFAGKVYANDLGSMLERVSWTISDIDENSTEDAIQYSYLEKNLTVGADMVNESGKYMPSCTTKIVLYEDGAEKEYSYDVSCKFWAIVWDGEYDE